MKRAPLDPGHVGVERLPGERVPEAPRARERLRDHARLDDLREAGGARRACHQVHVEGLAGHRGGIRRGARLAGQLGDAHQHRVPDARRERHLAGLRKLEPTRARAHRARHPKRPGELLDEEGQPLGAVMDRACEGRRRRASEHPREQLARLVLVERPERQLLEQAASPELVTQAPQPVVPREAVRPVGGHHQQRGPAQRLGERREQVERRVVGPLEVVEHDQRVPLVGHAREGGVHRLEQRGAVAGRRGLAELRQYQGEMSVQGPEVRQALRIGAQVGAQRGDHRAVGSAGSLGGAAPQRRLARLARQLLGEPCLAHPGLAREEHERSVAGPRGLERLAQQLALGLASDELVRGRHCESLGARRRPGRPPAEAGISWRRGWGPGARRPCRRRG